MINCANCQKKIIIKMITSMIDLKSRDIEKKLNLSKSVVSRHMTGEYNRPEIDIFVIEQAFGIKIKDYVINV